MSGTTINFMFLFLFSFVKGKGVELHYPNWVMAIALGMIFAGILPMPLVYLLRRFQILKVDLDIHQGSIRRNETTASTKEMIDQDDDVSEKSFNMQYSSICRHMVKKNNLFYIHNIIFLRHTQEHSHNDYFCVYIVYMCLILYHNNSEVIKAIEHKKIGLQMKFPLFIFSSFRKHFYSFSFPHASPSFFV